jgi:hypothetical protein
MQQEIEAGLSPRPEKQSIRTMPGSSPHSSISSTKLGLRSRQGSMVGTRRSSRAGSRRASSSGGVVGLPGASLLEDDPFDLDVFGSGDINFDDILNLNTTSHDPTQGDAVKDISNNIASQPQRKGSLPSTLPNGFDLGLDLHPVYDEQQLEANQTATLHNNHFGLTGGQSIQAAWDRAYVSYAPTNIENFPMDVEPIDTTLGLSALPGKQSIASQPPVPYQASSMYPDPQTLYANTQPYFDGGYGNGMYDNGPYFNGLIEQNSQAPIQQYEGYVPIGESLELQPPVTFPLEQDVRTSRAAPRPSSRQNDNLIIQPHKKGARSEPDLLLEMPIIPRRRQTQVIEHLSQEDVSEHLPHGEIVEHPREGKTTRHNSSASDSSSFEDQVEVPQPVRAGEKPKKVEGMEHVRTNTSTRGETTRTARINQYTEKGSKYKYKPLPLSENRPERDWATARFNFEYQQYIQPPMDGLKKAKLSADEIYDYITQFPNEFLRIWIQRTPADSSRRYPSGPYDDCRFEECPNRVWANKGTIEVGCYRVAFDEKHKKYGKNHVDPYDCAGYAHLYCMERFLDFPFICQVADVRVDDRVDMPKELNGMGKFAFSGKHESEKIIAERFLKAAKANALHRVPAFHDYPVHGHYAKGRSKPHHHTLTYALYEQNSAHRNKSQIKQFLARELKPGFAMIHMGDQEVKVLDNKIKARSDYKKWKKGTKHTEFPFADYYDDYIKQRIAQCVRMKEEYLLEDAADGASGGSKMAKKRKAATRKDTQAPSARTKRKRLDAEDSDDEPVFLGHDDDDDFDDPVDQQRYTNPVKPTRQSRRKKQRVDYTEPQDDPLSRQIRNNLTEHIHRPAYQPQDPYMTYSQYAPANTQQQGRGINNTVTGLGIAVPRKASGGAAHLFPTAQQYDIDQLPQPTAESEAERRLSWGAMAAVDALIEQYPVTRLDRRKSSTLSNGPYASIMKSPKPPGSPPVTRSSVRTASFNVQPVSSSKEYRIDDPPSQVATSPDLTRAVYDHQLQARRSARLASKASSSSSPSEKVESGRISKRRK